MGAFREWVDAFLQLRHGGLRLPAKIGVRDELWTTSQLVEVKRPNHISLDPRRPELPVIILRGLLNDYLLDGNRRINTWIKEWSDEFHKVWLVYPIYD